MKSTSILAAVVAVVIALLAAFTLLSLEHADTTAYVGFVQLIFGAATSIIGVVLVKRTGDAVSTAEHATQQVSHVSDQVSHVAARVTEVKEMVNGNTSDLLAHNSELIARIPTSTEGNTK